MESPRLQELVDAPRERLDVEYKAWLNFSDRETSAKLARHLCALANFGGGFLVFGIDNDMTPAGPRPAAAGPYDQDTLSGIVKRYLTPAFQVAVYEVTSVVTKTSHPVVWVPSHEAIPVCSARGGPEVGGKPVGIVRGTHYTRGAGPESVAITRPEQWAPVIRRCVLHERQALLAGLEPMLRSPGRPGVEPDESLRRWHEAGYRRFLELADSKGSGELLKRAHYQFSYEIDVAEGDRLEMAGRSTSRSMASPFRQAGDYPNACHCVQQIEPLGRRSGPPTRSQTVRQLQVEARLVATRLLEARLSEVEWPDTVEFIRATAPCVRPSCSRGAASPRCRSSGRPDADTGFHYSCDDRSGILAGRFRGELGIPAKRYPLRPAERTSLDDEDLLARGVDSDAETGKITVPEDGVLAVDGKAVHDTFGESVELGLRQGAVLLRGGSDGLRPVSVP